MSRKAQYGVEFVERSPPPGGGVEFDRPRHSLTTTYGAAREGSADFIAARRTS
jgi:hypothetical protein